MDDGDNATAECLALGTSEKTLYRLGNMRQNRNSQRSSSLEQASRRLLAILQETGTFFIETPAGVVCEYQPSIDIYSSKAFRRIEEDSSTKFEISLRKDIWSARHILCFKRKTGNRKLYRAIAQQIEQLFEEQLFIV